MRKLYPLLVLLLTFQFVNGQVTKNALLIGGDIAYSHSESEGTNFAYSNQTSFAFVPAIGIAIKNNLVVGAYFSFYLSKNEVDLASNDFRQDIVGGGIFVRKYKPLGKSDFSLFIQAKAGVEFDNTTRGDNTPLKGETNTFRILANVYPGISYRISKKLQLESGFNELLGIQYAHTKGYNGTVNPVRFEQKGFTIYTSLENVGSFYVGFRLLFNR